MALGPNPWTTPMLALNFESCFPGAFPQHTHKISKRLVNSVRLQENSEFSSAGLNRCISLFFCMQMPQWPESDLHSVWGRTAVHLSLMHRRSGPQLQMSRSDPVGTASKVLNNNMIYWLTQPRVLKPWHMYMLCICIYIALIKMPLTATAYKNLPKHLKLAIDSWNNWRVPAW